MYKKERRWRSSGKNRKEVEKKIGRVEGKEWVTEEHGVKNRWQ